MNERWTPPPELASFAELDHDRAIRRGYPEAIYGPGKTAAQLATIAEAIRAAGTRTLFTKIDPTQAAEVLDVLEDASYDPDSGMLVWPSAPPAPSGSGVVVAVAGTSDMPIAREAALAAQHLGRKVDLIPDVGVAGLHRILGHLDLLRDAGAVVVVAGMDGALPSVVAGLVGAPVIAVPTSVGYGASFGGLAALLTMLNACAPGVAVVNIDNGYGGGHLAAQITAPLRGSGSTQA